MEPHLRSATTIRTRRQARHRRSGAVGADVDNMAKAMVRQERHRQAAEAEMEQKDKYLQCMVLPKRGRPVLRDGCMADWHVMGATA